MKRRSVTEEQTAFSLRQAQSGTPVKEDCQKLQTSEQAIDPWKKELGGMGTP